MDSALNIPMGTNPTRQNIWRVLRVVGIILAAWSIVTGFHRLAFAFSAVIPPNNTVAIRITKTDRTIANLRSLTKGMNVVPGVPMSLADALSAADRTLNIWLADDGTVTMIFDRTLDDRKGSGLDSISPGEIYSDYEENITVISNNPALAPIQKSILKNIIPTIFSGDSATLTLGDNRTDISITSDAVTLHGTAFLAAPNIDEPISESTRLSADISASDVSAYATRAFTQNTPGFASLLSLAGHNGISARIDSTDEKFAYTFAIPLTPETEVLANEATLRAIAKELVEVPTIEGIPTFLDDGSKALTLRSREAATVIVRDDAPYRFVTATTAKGNAYITQTPTLLTVSNHIQDTSASQTRHASCLSGALAFVKPRELFAPLNTQTFYRPALLSNLLWNATEIASSLSETRICITP